MKLLFEDLWDNGMATPFFFDSVLDKINNTIAFRKETGAEKVVALRWNFEGVNQQCSLPVLILPNHDGVIIQGSEGASTPTLLVKNLDCTLRTILSIPVIDGKSMPDKGFFVLSEHINQGEIDWGVLGFDGNDYFIFDFDWNTGHLKRFLRKSRDWVWRR